ncbi:MAG: DEAD/DEAH box helicase [Clostridiales bacterium]|jgi:DEAD/DEAH box helicase domain-containing protein|nr:DEAD/DEAH box helicase [Clostridiales bacterium]
MKFSIYEKVVPRREPIYSDLPSDLLPEIKEYLSTQGIYQLYKHQADMFEIAGQRKNIVITTSTASGKTLSFLLPVLQSILTNPYTRAFFVYPTKALASDPYRAMLPLVEYFGHVKLKIGVYDGDTPVNDRTKIRTSANIILTNPEMLNTSFLPHHHNASFSSIFKNLKYVVIDELHSYRGAFGSHLANVMRRLERICNYYSSSQQFFCSSATIANPVELAENVCGDKFELISEDGSSSPQKHYYFLQPPTDRNGMSLTSPLTIATDLIASLVSQNHSFIAFCKSRRAVEVVTKESRDKLRSYEFSGVDYADAISGYRGGYTPEERKEIERKMIAGKLHGLISTNALELGIDIGKVDTTILTGYPGTRASFWQQSGRAGRSGQESNTYLILDNLPVDQYIGIDPDWLFENNSENAVIDHANPTIQLAHARAAAFELAIIPDDIFFKDSVELLEMLQEARIEGGAYTWCGKGFPAADISMRNIDKIRYKLISSTTGKAITEMEEMQAFLEIHKGSIYMHDSLFYVILDLDCNSRVATAKPIDVNYYTAPWSITSVSIIKTGKTKSLGRTNIHFGDLDINCIIKGHKHLQFHNHQNLGFEEIDPLSKSFDTEGVWIDIPLNVKHALNGSPKNYFEGLGFAIHNSMLMTTMTTSNDASNGIISHKMDDGTDNIYMAVCIYDLFVGGLGYSEKAYDVIEPIINNAIKMVSGCKCKDGCPACVGDYTLEKSVVLWELMSIYEELPAPSFLKVAPVPVTTWTEKPFAFLEIKDKWKEFTDHIVSKGEYFAKFLSTVTDVSVVETPKPKLTIVLSNAFYQSWISNEDNLPKLRNMLSHYIDFPIHDFELELAVDPSAKEDTDKREKLLKRYRDLTR